ncbi:mannose-1-phosphate guanylyltransferase/mannose-6-phosphate isomerase [Comamonas terrigena]|uniref:mannose-1-phosphate guanylyltransferase/mannose-6-phosphate isomerase n=1 Tax=Comamonas terrigena TaxID=32013 RepID=UPI00289CDB4A|nr:mannose-1-phosphate guanylyltransferase/mannose-6-phosphate isomerase [Comamonas terrigena]
MIAARPVILCGGSGTRLWPLSRSGFPKQFLSLTGSESLFQQAAKRLVRLSSNEISIAAPYVVTNEEHRFLAWEQMREAEIGLGATLLEPSGRNTAPALTLAALAALEEGNDPILVVTPADQNIGDDAAFTKSLRLAIEEAEENRIVILGVRPTRPETGFGYIKADKLSAYITENILSVSSFVEKPDAEKAKKYLDDGRYFWNSGIFVLRASIWLQLLEEFREDILAATKLAWSKRKGDTSEISFVRPDPILFEKIPAESVDYAVIEKCVPKFPLSMVILDAGWSDLGAWDSVWENFPKDDALNAHYGDVLLKDCRNTLVHASSRLVSMVGVEDMVVVETPDAVLVTDRSRSQDVKGIVEMLNGTKRAERAQHRKVHRPWGWYDSIDEGERFKVKRIKVKPKASLSLQKHHHRAEHWIVVKGTAEITNGEKTFILTENQSTYIPCGEVHRLANPGTIPLEIIEVQSGSYLGEDDIVRYSDKYGRTE